MKQAEDQKTIDMHGMPRKRGRPSTGSAKDAAERKRDQRRRDMKEVLKFEELGEVTDSGLLALMANAGLRGSIGKDVWIEWGKRKGFIS